MLIEDGKGSGYRAEVNQNNQLNVFSVTEKEIAYHSQFHGAAYIWTATADWGADKNAIWLRNNSTKDYLIIQQVTVSPAASCLCEIWVGNGNTAGGTAVVGVNLNRSSKKAADATCTHTNTNVDAGAGMTLLNSFYSLATFKEPMTFDGALVLGYYDELAVNLVTDVGITAVGIFGYFRASAL